MSGTKKKRKIKKLPLIIILVVCLIGVWVLGGYILMNHTSFFSKKTTKKSAVEKRVVVQKEDVDYEAKVFMVGDALIHSSIYIDAKQDDGSYDFKPMLQYIKPIASKYDIAYYNQETVLGGADLGYSNYPRFNTPDACGDAFIDAGFNAVSLATNHTMDKGEVGVLHSVEYWKQHPNVAASGQWSSYDERAASVAKVYEVNNIKYGFISYTIWTNGLETPYGKDYLNSLYSPEKAQADIASIRDKVDFVIVAMHWGTEYAWYVDAKQEEIANYLSGLGVDLIIGAHPHVVQTVEYINDGKTFVVYSLGNFISDQLDVDNYTGLAMEVTLRKHIGTDGKSVNSVVEPKAQLIYTTVTQRRGWSSDFRVKMYPTLTDDELRNHDSHYEKYKAIVNQRYPELTWGLTWE
ncbi:MAG: CapA family protein [Bacilli bacterium]|nr:CapA family protein [Bacilli bacterium]